MSVKTRAEIRSHTASVTRETDINSLINSFIDLTLQEINDPSWATKRGLEHNWSWNKRKDTIDTVTDTEDYILPRDLDKMAFARQTDSPIKLIYVPDEVFYRRHPDPTATGRPTHYRLWEEEGLSVRLAVADTVTVVSSSASDGSSISISVVGYDTDGIKRSEVINLNGTSTVGGTITWDATRPLRISKSADTVGVITVTETSGATTILKIGEHERSPRFRVISFFPIPSSAITISLEYFTRIRNLEHDASVPDIDSKWTWVVVAGVLSKIYQYQNKGEYPSAFEVYRNGVRAMVKADIQRSDYIAVLKRHSRKEFAGRVELGDQNFSLRF